MTRILAGLAAFILFAGAAFAQPKKDDKKPYGFEL